MLRGNLVGFAMIVVSALAVIVGKYVLNLDDATTMPQRGAWWGEH